jgi:hypothetical protein
VHGDPVAELGEAALTLVRSGEVTNPTLTAIYEQIKEAEAKVKSLEDEIAELKASEKVDAELEAMKAARNAVQVQ